ncbi:MAG: glycosyltransferase family 39 protein [Chloroflexi bacterium]|nr:glycosyltransferase family 39 protein [Chloroflexota bacterium]
MTFNSNKQNRVVLGILLGIIFLAFALRLVNLNGRPFWYDEAFSVLYAEKPFATMLYGTIAQTDGAAADVHPLFYYTILHGWMGLAGQSAAAVRLLSVLLGVTTVIVVYLLGCYLFGRRAGLLAALITAVAPFALYYAQETRMYALLGLAAVTTTYFFARAWVEQKRWQWLAFAAAGAVTLYAHNLGAMFIAGLGIWVLWTWWRERQLRHLRPFFLACCLMLLLFAPWLAILPSQFGKIQQAYWVARPDLVSLLQTSLIFHLAYDNQALPAWLLPLAIAFSLFLPVILLLEWRRGAKAGSLSTGVFPTPVGLLFCLAFLPPLLTFLISQWRSVFIVRALLPSALAYYTLAAGILVNRSFPRPIRWGTLLVAAILALFSLQNHYRYAEFPRSPFAETAVFLAQEAASPDDMIIHSNKMTFFPTHYYNRRLPMAFIADEPGSPADSLAYATQEALGLYAIPDLETAVANHPRIWFVIFQAALAEYETIGQTHPHLSWLNAHYRQTNLVQFNDLSIYIFEQK